MDVTAWAIALMEFLGGPGTALVIASEALFPPVPGEVLLPFAGVTAAANDQHVLVPIFWTTLGSVLGGLGGEIAARISEQCFYHLEAPVLRVGGYHLPYPPSRMEHAYLPDLDRVLDGVDRLLEH